MTEIQLRHLVEDIDKANAEYILNDYDIKEAFRWVNRYIAKGDTEMAVYETTVLARKIMQFGERHLTPANAKVGDGATICLWSDRHAGTIIKVIKCSITIRQDTAILDKNFKPEWIPGGFAAHCTNQDEQEYTYEPNENGQEYTIRWSKAQNSFGRHGDIRAIKGRHEFYDYNF